MTIPPKRRKFGDILVDGGLITATQLQQALAFGADREIKLGEALHELGFVNDAAVANTIALMAAKRRLFVLPQVISAVKAMAAAERGEVTAEVTAAKALTKTQEADLAKSLKAATGKDVSIKLTVDESLIGGLIVKVGSRMIDSSIRSKLSNLHNAMKEVG